MSNDSTIDQLVKAWKEGDLEAPKELIEVLYPRLRLIARSAMSKERDIRTIQATELVGGIYEQLCNQPPPEDQIHFLNRASQLMERLLVDYARWRKAKGRWAGQRDLSLSMLIERKGIDCSSEQIIDLKRAISTLERHHPRKAQVVKYKFFIGLEVPEIAAILGVSEATIKRDWHFSRSWLKTQLL